MDSTNHNSIIQKIHTRNMLLDAGCSRRKIAQLISTQKLMKLRKSIYIDGDFYRNLWPSHKAFAQIYGVHLAAPGTIFSHTSAAYLHRLPVISWDGATHLLTPYGSNTNMVGTKKHVRINPADFGGYFSPEQVQCTTPLQTIIDCAVSGSLQQAVVLADTATYRGLVASEHLKESLLQVSGRGCRRAHLTAGLFDPGCESIGESLTRLAIKRAGLPDPVSQFWVEAQGYNYRLDLAYPHLKIAIEFDGHLKYTDFGSAEDAVFKERQRERHLHNAGWKVVRVDWETITRRPEVFIASLRRVLAG